MSRNILMRSSALGLVAALGLTPAAAFAQASASAYTSAVRYDLARRVTGTIAPDPDGAGTLHYAAVRTTYNAAGLVSKVEKGELASWQAETIAPASWTGFTVFSQVETSYDVMNRKRLELVRTGAGVIKAATHYSYDQRGLLECTAVRMNPTLYGSTPASNLGACSLGTAGSDGPDRITRNSYNSDGLLTKVTRAYGITTANGFPATLEQDYQRYEYSANGRATAVTDANNNRSEMTYDGLDRQKRLIFPSKTNWFTADPANYEEYGYDNNANRTSLRKRDGTTIIFDFDALNRQWRKTVPAVAGGAPAYSVYSAYDNLGLQLYARFGSSSGSGITSTYDGFGRQESASTNMDGTTRTLAYTYDNDGNRKEIGAAGTVGTNFHVWYLYDGLDRMTTVRPGVSTWTAAQMDYNAQGLRAHLYLGPNGTVTSSVTYGYDGLDRLTSLDHQLAGTANDQLLGFDNYNAASQVRTRTSSNDLYAYNRAYNISRDYYVNGLNQYRDAGGYAYGYDLNGNLTDDGVTLYAYDQENRLLSAKDKASGTVKATLAYDPLGRLWQVTGNSATTRFTYDGDRRIEEYDGAGTRLRNYIHGPGTDEPLVAYELPPTYAYQPRYLHADHQGSIIGIADDNGNPIAINAYDAWGIPNTGNQGKFAYTGQAWLPELGMYYYKARIYSPTLGRFMQTDPIGYKDQMNLYAYVGNDPVDKTDPSGLTMSCPDAKICAKVVAAINARASGTYAANKKGEITRVGTNNDPKRSQYYSGRLDQAIASKYNISITVSSKYTDPQTGKSESVDKTSGGGVTIGPSQGNQSITISGHSLSGLLDTAGKALRDTKEDILAHELVGHAIPGVVGADTGNAILNENKVRAQVSGGGQRALDPNHAE